jgi:hypothetical protein
MSPPQSPRASVTTYKVQASPIHPITPIKAFRAIKNKFPPIVPIIISPTKDSPASPIPDWFRLDCLPEEMLEEISRYLTVTELNALRLASRHMYRISLRVYACKAFKIISTDFSERSLARIHAIIQDDIFRPQLREIAVRWTEIDRKADRALVEAFWVAFNRFENCKVSEACRFFVMLRTHR